MLNTCTRMLEEAAKDSAQDIVKLIKGNPTPKSLYTIVQLIENYGGDMKSALLITVAFTLSAQHPQIKDEFLHAVVAVASERR